MNEFKPDPKPEPRKKKEKKPIKKTSKSRQADQRLYEIVRERYLNNNPICEVCGTTHSDQIHHKKGKIGSLLYNERYFLAVCFPCHRHIEDNPEFAKREGYSLNRLDV